MMHPVSLKTIPVETRILKSEFLQRQVDMDLFLPPGLEYLNCVNLLLTNDGQDMHTLGLEGILKELYDSHAIKPLIIVAIHAGKERKMEYGIASEPDFKGRGARARLYTSFILDELLPFLEKRFSMVSVDSIAISGFSLGGLSAMDIAWSHPEIFSRVGVFSGSFWWRSLDQNDKNYDDDKHRIMHQVVRNGHYKPGLSFFFQCGNQDETRDRNNNGIIDSIDDTRDLIHELEKKGYEPGKEIAYLEWKDGRHDLPTLARSLPRFLTWAFGKG